MDTINGVRRVLPIDSTGAIVDPPSAASTGAVGDTAYSSTNGSASGSIIGLLKGLYVKLNGQIVVRGPAGDTSIAVAGNANAAAADSGAPVKVGGKRNTTPPAYTDGQRGDVQLAADGSVYTSERGAPGLATAVVSAATTAGGTLLAALRAGRKSITLINEGTTAVRIGVSGLTTGTGALLPGVVGATITLNTSAAVYGITASGTQAVSVIELF